MSIFFSLLIFGFGIAASLLTGKVDTFDSQIFWALRVPRTLLGLSIGGGLSVAGVFMQATLSNPLADPYTLGIASAAVLGSVLGGIFFHLPFLANSIFAFIFCVLYFAILINFLKRKFHNASEIILTGIIFGLFFTALSTFLSAIIDPATWSQQLSWILGQIPVLSLTNSIFVFLVIIVLGLIGSLYWKSLDLLSTDEISAQTAGLEIEVIRKRFFIIISLITAICVSVAGVIGFVGFVVPHLLRRLGCKSHLLLIPNSFLFGAGFLLISDSIARVLIPQTELPVGIILSILGAPLFLILLKRSSA